VNPAVPARVVRAEWIKLWSVRSTYIVLILAVTLGLGVGWLDIASTASHWATMAPADRASFDPVADSFIGFQYAELAFAALGVLVGTTEYATGTIRVSLTAVPDRRRLYAAKAVVLGGLILVLCEICAFAAFLVAQVLLREPGLGVGIGDSHVIRAVICTGVYLAIVTMVGALAAVFGLVFLAWPLARALEGVSYVPDRWLLVNAGDALAATHSTVGPHAQRAPSVGLAAIVLAS
jgi:ABC-2 type transport system permease protein